jgi:hypothetical protein
VRQIAHAPEVAGFIRTSFSGSRLPAGSSADWPREVNHMQSKSRTMTYVSAKRRIPLQDHQLNEPLSFGYGASGRRRAPLSPHPWVGEANLPKPSGKRSDRHLAMALVRVLAGLIE